MRNLKKFIEKHWDQKSPLLLGYSGGPDSKALLYALLEAGVTSLHVAHVDHGWRQESASQADELRREVIGLGLPFHITRLTLPLKGNREAVAREERFAFFQDLRKKIPFQALFLAHQKIDVAETVLKRIFEGAHLPLLGGMKEVSLRGGLTIWRPLLNFDKSEILTFLKSRKLTPLIDPSNLDPIYLRARMRSEMFPFLKEKFGKEFEGNLFHLSERASELRDYLDKKIEQIPIDKGPWGAKISFLGLEKIEARHLLQKMIPKLSRDFLETVLDALLLRKPDCRFSPTLFIDRGILFLLNDEPPRFEGVLDLTPGEHLRGDWRIEIVESTDLLPLPNWQDIWTGSFAVSLPHGALALPPSSPPFRKLWNETKVPSFLRFAFPLFVPTQGLLKEFLSGKGLPEKLPLFKVTFCVLRQPCNKLILSQRPNIQQETDVEAGLKKW